ncbi:hypothetical protein ACI3PL_21295, partial [Lacticaseibacillus paracasei]
GDFTSKTISYVDYIKESNSLYNTAKFTSIDPKFKTPPYPNITDYYNVKLVLDTGAIDSKIVNNLNDNLRSYISNSNNKNNVIIILTNYGSN